MKLISENKNDELHRGTVCILFWTVDRPKCAGRWKCNLHACPILGGHVTALPQPFRRSDPAIPHSGGHLPRLARWHGGTIGLGPTGM